MIVNFEFLGSESIENVITCLNFKVEKVVFFGYADMIQEHQKNTENFLKKYCGVQKVVFHALSQENLQKMLSVMRKEIEYELCQKNKIYFDITGGESMILVAFGMLSKEYKTPIHMYDIPENHLIEFDDNRKMLISKRVPSQKVAMNLERYIELKGGVINDGLHKENKSVEDKVFEKEVMHLWQVAQKYWNIWNSFSDFLRANMTLKEDFNAFVNTKDVLNALSKSTSKLKKVEQFNEIIDALAQTGALQNVQYDKGKYMFSFKNQFIKECLWEGGRILELYTYMKEREQSDDCRIGVHLDWDGVIHSQMGIDVLNEIDVLSLNGNIPTFISCKSGKMTGQQALHALYELETVAKKFGGKYAKKVLVSVQKLGDVYLKRAEEMDINIMWYNIAE